MKDGLIQDRGGKEKEATLREFRGQNQHRLVSGYEARKETNVKISSLRKEAYDKIQDGTKKYKEEM